MDVAKHHACHANCRGATGDQLGPSAPPNQNQSHKGRACHSKRTWVSASATATQKQRGCHQEPRLPRQKAVNVTVPRLPRKRNVDHAKQRSMSPSARPATPSRSQCQPTRQSRHQAQPSPASAMLATQNEGRCHQVRVPRRTPVNVTECSPSPFPPRHFFSVTFFRCFPHLFHFCHFPFFVIFCVVFPLFFLVIFRQFSLVFLKCFFPRKVKA